MFGVHHGDDGIQAGFGFDVFIDKEGLRDRCRVGEAGGFHDDTIEFLGAFHQPADDADQVAADGAADAAVIHLEHFFIGIHDEVVIDAELAEFIDDDGVFFTVIFGKDAVEEGGFTGAEIAGEDGNGD